MTYNILKLFVKKGFYSKNMLPSVTQLHSMKMWSTLMPKKTVEYFLQLRHTLVFQVELSLRLPSRNICLRHFSCYCLLFYSGQYCMSRKMINIATTYNFDILSFAFERRYWIYYMLWTEKQWLKQMVTESKCKLFSSKLFLELNTQLNVEIINSLCGLKTVGR